MKKVLIIGSQGYLGTRLTDYLHKYGYTCVGADTGFFQYGVLHYPINVPMMNCEARTIKESDLDGFDVVILFAGISNDPLGNLEPEIIYDPTRDYAKRIAKMCKKLGIRFLFPSSCSVYGIGDGILNEDGATLPQTAYSLNKIQIEQELSELADDSFSPIALRLATVFGLSPRMRFDLVINMLCGMAVTSKKVVLNSDGQAWRPHLHIDDVCEAFRCCIEWDYQGGKLAILNVGRNDNNWKILDIANLIQSKVDGCKLEFLGDGLNGDGEDLIRDRKVQDGVDKRTYQVSFDRIHSELPGFKSCWTVDQGIEQLILDLERLELNDIKFKQRDFYRLQQAEHLYRTDQIDERLNIKFQ
jgi:nucleoside-diphosphate-sugar epimerase